MEHYFIKHRTNLNNIRTRTCSSIGDPTWTLYFWPRTNGHWTSNLIGPSTTFTNLFIKQTRTLFLNIKWSTQTYSSFGKQTRIPYFWLFKSDRTMNIVGPITTKFSRIQRRWLLQKICTKWHDFVMNYYNFLWLAVRFYYCQ